MKNPHDEKQTAKVLLLLLLFPVIWAALLVAPFFIRGTLRYHTKIYKRHE